MHKKYYVLGCSHMDLALSECANLQMLFSLNFLYLYLSTVI